MMLTEQIFAQAVLLGGELDERQRTLLKILCDGAASSLAARLREGLAPEDCKADFIAASSLFALAALGGAGENSRVEEFKAGDLTVKQVGGDAASRCLYHQAQMIILPYLKDRFAFVGV